MDSDKTLHELHTHTQNQKLHKYLCFYKRLRQQLKWHLETTEKVIHKGSLVNFTPSLAFSITSKYSAA